ncbi:MAG: TlpA family protein disulfide reductase [Myxococcales bacterium]|nr:TlpA family protein disulfide reductase [Myxococcales bacterium]
MTLSAAVLAASLSAAAAQAGKLERLGDARSLAFSLRPSSSPLIVHFWALWCAPCREELPRQVRLAHRAKEKGIAVLMINLDGFAKEEAARALLAKLGALEVGRHAQLDPEVQPSEVSALLEQRWSGSLPATFGILPGGKVASSVLGTISPRKERALLGSLLPKAAVKPAGE